MRETSKFDPRVSTRIYFDEGLDGLDLLLGSRKALHGYVRELLRAVLTVARNKSLRRSDLERLRALFSAAVDSLHTQPIDP